jgi:hypothetical protein
MSGSLARKCGELPSMPIILLGNNKSSSKLQLYWRLYGRFCHTIL